MRIHLHENQFISYRHVRWLDDYSIQLLLHLHDNYLQIESDKIHKEILWRWKFFFDLTHHENFHLFKENTKWRTNIWFQWDFYLRWDILDNWNRHYWKPYSLSMTVPVYQCKKWSKQTSIVGVVHWKWNIWCHFPTDENRRLKCSRLSGKACYLDVSSVRLHLQWQSILDNDRLIMGFHWSLK